MKIFMMDVESDGLYGDGFHYGAVAFDTETGNVQLFGQKSTKFVVTTEWVQDNVKNLFGADIESDVELPVLRGDFWDLIQKYKELGYTLYGDCIFPVETNFLAAAVMDDRANREAFSPFPILDLGTLVDPNASRFTDAGIPLEKQHDPIWDSIASMIVLLKKLGIKTSVTNQIACDYFKTVAVNMGNDKLAKKL